MSSDSSTVLVVDDSESTRYMLSSWLRGAGYAVVEAGTAAEGFAVLAQQDVNLVVLDVQLPDANGLDVCTRIKSDPATEAIPVLHVSATAVAVSDRAEGLQRGADGYLIEPVEREELVAFVHALLRYYGARHRAEAMAARLSRLNEATLRFNEATDMRALLRAAAEGVTTTFGADAVVVLHESGTGGIAVSTGETPPEIGPLTSEGERRLLCEAMLARTSHTLRPHLRPPAAAALLDSPHHVVVVRSARPTGTIGAIAVAGDPEEASETEPVLVQIAQALARAVENLRVLQVEHVIATRLQRALLPASLPTIDGVAVAAEYVASTEQSQVGGDFYEAFERDDDVVVLAIGDVQGHSLESATIMAELRHSLRAWALDGLPAGAIVDRLNRLFLRFHGDKIASVWLGLWDRRTSELQMANAGHIPPLVVRGGRAEYVPMRGALLGLPAGPRPSETIHLPPGSVIVLTTDGLLDRRDLPLDTGLDMMAATVERDHGDLDELCARLIREIGPSGEAPDDIAVMAVRITAPAAPT